MNKYVSMIITNRLLATVVVILFIFSVSVPRTYGVGMSTEQKKVFDSGVLAFDVDESAICINGDPSTVGGGANVNFDYAGNTILNTAQLEAIRNNQSTYENAANEVDIPWQMIAVIHLRENGLKRTNPSNGQGVYQFYNKQGGPYPTGDIGEAEFLRQSVLAAEFIKAKAGSNYEPNRDLNKNSAPEVIKDTFFGYNGRAGVYEDQAKNIGFSSPTEGYEGSPYVMNKADAKRDPDTAAPNTWGQIKTDGGGIEYPANDDYGAFVVYASLVGIPSSGAGCSTTIADGGLTLEQAKAFMMRYGENVNGFSAKQSGALWNACSGGGSNCVTFSYFFNHTFTDLPAGMADGNGEAIVGTLRSKGANGGTTPKVFSTFSWDGGTYGHTGIVLGINGNEIIVGHASCSNPNTGKGDGTYEGGGSGFVFTGTLDDDKAFWGTKPSGFAYPDNVDTQAIQEFIDNGYVSNAAK